MPTIEYERYTKEEDFRELEEAVDAFSEYTVKIFENHKKRIHELEMVVITLTVAFAALAVILAIVAN